jgi:hypothetical protein
MFRDAKPGQKVWCVLNGWGVIKSINNSWGFPVRVYFEHIDYEVGYTYDGKLYDNNENPCLFWDEIQITPPPKPKRKVKKTVVVWLNPKAIINGNGGCFYLTDDPTKEYLKPATLTYEIEE